MRANSHSALPRQARPITPDQGNPRAAAWRQQHAIPTPIDGAGSQGYRLQCGRVVLWSVPLEFLFGASPAGFTHVVTVNAEIFALAHGDARLASILAHSVNTIDGRVLQWLCRLLYPSRPIRKQSGATFIVDLANHCRRHSQRLFLLGSSEKSNALAVNGMRAQFPGLEVSGYSPPFQDYPFDRTWNDTVLDKIRAARPGHLVVCLGPPKQEYWIDENASALAGMGVHRAYGLGGSIDFVAGTKTRAPRWIQFIGSEWLFRLACEPRARFGRTLTMFRMPLLAARTERKIEAL